MAELAFMLPLMLVLVIGVIEVNSAMNAYITVVNSARDGARLGSKGSATTGEIQTLVVKDLDRLPQTVPVSNVTVTYPNISGQDSVRVESCYDHETLLQVPLLIPGTFRMCSQTTMPKLN
jgi:Flp pilus assembly protein TadG